MTNQARLLLTKLRGGDYAHPGSEEAIEMMVRDVLALKPEIKTLRTLDTGSGLGGTAHYLYQLGFKKISGIDLDPAAVEYSKSKYPHINFEVHDALKTYRHKFEFIYLMNVAYAIADKSLLTQALTQASVPGTILVISDYTTSTFNILPLTDLSGKHIYPIKTPDMIKILEQHNWKILKVSDITESYTIWYGNLLKRLSAQHNSLLRQFSLQDFLKVQDTFESLLTLLKQNAIGGVTIYAQL